MWISKEAFTSKRNLNYTADQHISDAAYYLLDPEDQTKFKKIQFQTEVLKPEYDSNPNISLTGNVLSEKPSL